MIEIVDEGRGEAEYSFLFQNFVFSLLQKLLYE